MTVFSGWTPLHQRLIQISQPATFHILNNVYTDLNGMREWLTGAPTAGISVQSVEGHDHTETGGGAILPRGLVDGFDQGENDSTNGYMKEIDGTEVDTWFDAGDDVLELDSHFYPHITDGIHSGKTNNSSAACTLKAHLVFYAQNDGVLSGSFRCRLKNLDTGATSSVVTQSLGVGSNDIDWKTITDVPLNPESGLHRYKLQFLGTRAGVMRVFACQLYETRDQSQPASDGDYRYNETGATDRP